MDEQSSFPTDFDEVFLVAGVAGNQARFGLDVLAGLVDGIGDFIEARRDRWRPGLRSLGPALIASAMWIDDDELIEAIGHLTAASVVVTKQGRRPTDLRKLAPLANSTNGHQGCRSGRSRPSAGSRQPQKAKS